MYLAHGPISYILNESIQKKNISKLSKQEHILVMILSILFGILPDIDLAILSMTNIPSFQHHSVFTHSAIFYISIWLILHILVRVLKKVLNKESRLVLRDELLNVILWSFLIGTLSHFLADLLFSYSLTLFPIQNQITILGNIFKFNYFTSYIFTPAFATEMLFLGIFLLLISKKYLKEINPLKYILYFFISLSFVYMLFTMYMNLNTYNNAYHFVDRKRNEDIDYDGIQDRYDTDTDNDGVRNIYQLDRGEGIEFVKSISTGKYLVTNSSDTWEKIKYNFGALGSYRLISQTYFEQNLPLEPVLREYYRSKNTPQTYRLSLNYPELLYEYLNEYGVHTTYDKGLYIGDIFFVMEVEKVMNMGIVVGEDTFGIVLPDDTRLVTHNLEEILKHYKATEIKVLSVLQEE
ncbi:MAG: metal-dependent hydrolase [Candidatus Dojkabacteria bacterium]|jgi:hypothetical protein|nr:metal-dependent hydrolase [Candidatus Dojkabacteria bacterium]